MASRSLLFQVHTFQKIILTTIAVTFLLIFIGGLVRATGAGLGCPDWPKCFGLWIPPVDAAGLPDSYDKEQFNVFKTWMEYVNRLFGVLVGFFIVLSFLTSVRHLASNKSAFFGSLTALILVLFQGWLGGQVVQSGLEGWKITIHMITAVIILNVLIWTAYRSLRDRLVMTLEPGIRKKMIAVLVVLITVTIVQVVLGTQVREALEAVKASFPALDRAEWMYHVGRIDMVHRSFSWIVLIFVVMFNYLAVRYHTGRLIPWLAGFVTGSTILQILLGAGLVYLGIPPAFQVFHLLIAALMTSLTFLALLLVSDSLPKVTGNT